MLFRMHKFKIERMSLMNKENCIVNVTFDQEDWQEVYRFFKGYASVDINDIPPKYQDYIIPTRDIMMEQAKVVMKYNCVDISEKNEEGIVLENGKIFTGQMIKKAYKDAKQLVLFVITVANIDDILKEHPDMMDTFFLEFWAVSMLAVARDKLNGWLDKELDNTGFQKTSVWSPGQAKFELQNQKPLFETLEPEEIGVILDKHMRMVPLKSVSGTIGIVPDDKEIEMISCDYCEHNETCPGYAGTRLQNNGKVRSLR